jgi:type IV pilus assembly protein PilB
LSIITVEDPIEYAIEGVVQGGYDARLGVRHMDYIKAMMRQDPDAIMIGEIRDSETAQSAIQVSLTGHKVFSTFHTDDTVGALIRLLDMGIEPYLVASTVGAVLSQRLVRMVCRHCREPVRPGPELLKAFALTEADIASHTLYRGRGCPKCHQTGYKGRTGIHELLLMNEDIRDAILHRRSASEVRAVARSRGQLVSLREDGIYKVVRGATTLEEIDRVVAWKDEDTPSRKSLAELIELCGGLHGAAGRRDNTAATAAQERSLPEPLFHIAIDCGDLKKEHGKIVRLHEEYDRVARPQQRMSLAEFVEEFARNVQRVANGRPPGSVTFSIRYKGGSERIFMERPPADPIEVTPTAPISSPV